ncbi:Bgt-20878 [Blumeria graminis f. sp. tritici]|uniref:Bgt-20878 n=2 Tax=Blumeria graminis f. sp. tritici TaxID=62690 RepID=A0A381LC18_BLUGR|nr:Bgt-20878 [Blumeria graminis f. sp. tritici]
MCWKVFLLVCTKCIAPPLLSHCLEDSANTSNPSFITFLDRYWRHNTYLNFIPFVLH